MTTPDQIQQLKQNCYNMTRWLDHVHDYAQDIVNEVYFKITEVGKQDQTQKWASSIMDLTMAVVADMDFPGAAITGFALQGIVGSFADNTPGSLNKQFGEIWERFSATFQQMDTELAQIQADPVGNWNKSYKDPITGKVFTVSSLAGSGVYFPTNDLTLQGTPYYDPVKYDAAFDKVLVAFKYNMAKNVLGLKWSILHQPNHTFWSGWNDADARNFAKDQINGNRDVFLVWWHDQDGSCAGCPNNGISTSEPRLGVGEWYANWDYYHGETAPKDLCDWLMQDDGFGTTLNPDAITTRHDVFFNWPLEGNLNDHPEHSPRPKKQMTPVSEESSWKARQWHKYFAENPRHTVEHKIAQRCIDDPVFRANLVKNPKQTLSEYAGIPIPKEVEIEVIQETPGQYKLVIPYVGAPRRST